MALCMSWANGGIEIKNDVLLVGGKLSCAGPIHPIIVGDRDMKTTQLCIKWLFFYWLRTNLELCISTAILFFFEPYYRFALVSFVQGISIEWGLMLTIVSHWYMHRVSTLNESGSNEKLSPTNSSQMESKEISCTIYCNQCQSVNSPTC